MWALTVIYRLVLIGKNKSRTFYNPPPHVSNAHAEDKLDGISKPHLVACKIRITWLSGDVFSRLDTMPRVG